MSVATPRPAVRSPRAGRTRELILDTAERPFAEHGIASVSNRQISEAAGQSNHFAVGYHFGDKAALTREIVRRHTDAVERRRTEMLDALEGTAAAGDPRAWVACLVRPVTGYLAERPAPTWYARFVAQAEAEPSMRAIIIAEGTAAPSVRRVADAMDGLVPELPERVRRERTEMSITLIVHTLAARERDFHRGAAAPGTTWATTATGLIDAIVGLLTAPPTDPDTSEG